MPTIQDVARTAQVSPATVSRVLNGSFAVSEDKRKKVLDAVEALGYSLPVRTHAEPAGRTILLLSAIEKPALFHAVRQEATQAGYNVVFGLAGEFFDGLEYAKQLIKSLDSTQLAGILLLNIVHIDEELRTMLNAYPVVQIERQIELPGSSIVATDNCSAMHEAVSHLIAQARKHIAYITMQSGSWMRSTVFELRRRGYISALADHGLEINSKYIINTDFSMEGGESACAQLLALHPVPDAVCCAGDALALGVMHALQTRGLRIPQDIAVSGFDNDPYAAFITPALTTVDLNLEQIGREAAQLLIRMATSQEEPRRTLLIPHQLIVRASSETA